MFAFLTPFKMYFIIGAIVSILGLAWGLKSSIENNAIQKMENELLIESIIELDKLHEEEKKIVKFDTRFHTEKKAIEKSLKRIKDANINSIDDSDIYFSL